MQTGRTRTKEIVPNSGSPVSEIENLNGEHLPFENSSGKEAQIGDSAKNTVSLWEKCVVLCQPIRLEAKSQQNHLMRVADKEHANIFSFLRGKDRLHLALADKASYHDFKSYNGIDKYVIQFDNMVMLAANACMYGLKLLKNMTDKSCLAAIIFPSPNILGVKRRKLSSRELETLILNAISIGAAEAIELLLDARFISRNYMGSPAVRKHDEDVLLFIYQWTNLRSSPSANKVLFFLELDRILEIIETVGREVMQEPLNDRILFLMDGQRKSIYDFQEYFWNSVAQGKIKEVQEVMISAPYLIFGEGYILESGRMMRFLGFFHGKCFFTGEMRTLLLQNGVIPTHQMIVAALAAKDIESFEVFEKYGFVNLALQKQNQVKFAI